MPIPISRSPNDPPADSGAGSIPPSRVSRGIPAAPLRSVPRPDPADTNTLTMLGSNPLNSPDAGIGNAATGSAGLAFGSMSMVAKGLQGLNAWSPGFVPAEILIWADGAMQQLPAIVQQQQSVLSAPPGSPMAGPMPQSTPSALGPSSAAMAPPPSAATDMSMMGGMGGRPLPMR